jgi:glutathione peroxidase-family protein
VFVSRTEKINVNGLGTDATWTWIKSQCPAAVSDIADDTPSWTPITVSDVAWNFETILFDRTGAIYRRYATAVDPRAIAGDVAYLLAH